LPSVRRARSQFAAGKYSYGLDTADYIDMTRDALDNTKTVQFSLDSVKRRADGVSEARGKHLYARRDGKNRAVYVSYVLEKRDKSYYITEVGASPDRIEE
jgi:hypothetical protein